MSFIDFARKQINFRIAYYGSPTAQPMESIQYLYNKAPAGKKSALMPILDSEERRLMFDFLPNAMEFLGLAVRLHLQTVPGTVFFASSHRKILQGADGVVFVASADRALADETFQYWRSLLENLEAGGFDPTTPIVIQINHSDRPGAMSQDEVLAALGAQAFTAYPAVVESGAGHFDVLKEISKLLLMNQRKRASSEQRPPA